MYENVLKHFGNLRMQREMRKNSLRFLICLPFSNARLTSLKRPPSLCILGDCLREPVELVLLRVVKRVWGASAERETRVESETKKKR